MKTTFFLIALFIVFASLYPFAFSYADFHNRLPELLQTFFDSHSSRGDILGNILLFIPLGYVTLHAFRGNPLTIVSLILLIGGFAGLVQLGQFFVPARDPNIYDIYYNLAGVLLGISLAAVTHSMLEGKRKRAKTILGENIGLVPALLLGCWLVYRLTPFVPTIDFSILKWSLKPLLKPGEIQLTIDGVARAFGGWLLAAELLRRLVKGARLDSYLPMIVVVTMLAETVILHNRVTLSNVVGAWVAIFAWKMYFSDEPVEYSRSIRITILLMTTIAIDALAPWQQSNYQINSFSWIPFSGILAGAIMTNILAIHLKLFLFGGLVYLATSFRWSIFLWAFVYSAMLFALEWQQTYLPGRSPEITDSIMPILAAFVIFFAPKEHAHGSINHHPVKGRYSSKKTHKRKRLTRVTNGRHRRNLSSKNYQPSTAWYRQAPFLENTNQLPDGHLSGH